MTNIENDLYAEIAVPDEPVDEEYGYFVLKEAIIKQAAEKGIERERLAFWYDGQEQSVNEIAKTLIRIDNHIILHRRLFPCFCDFGIDLLKSHI